MSGGAASGLMFARVVGASIRPHGRRSRLKHYTDRSRPQMLLPVSLVPSKVCTCFRTRHGTRIRTVCVQANLVFMSNGERHNRLRPAQLVNSNRLVIENLRHSGYRGFVSCSTIPDIHLFGFQKNCLLNF